LGGAPRPYHLRRGDDDSVVFCFAKPDDAEALCQRFDGERNLHLEAEQCAHRYTRIGMTIDSVDGRSVGSMRIGDDTSAADSRTCGATPLARSSFCCESRWVCVADTWHETLEAAKSQASSEYGIEESDWKAV